MDEKYLLEMKPGTAEYINGLLVVCLVCNIYGYFRQMIYMDGSPQDCTFNAKQAGWQNLQGGWHCPGCIPGIEHDHLDDTIHHDCEACIATKRKLRLKI